MNIHEVERKLTDYLISISPYILKKFRGAHTVEAKADTSLVTETDTEVEKMLKEKLGGLLPDSYFLGEEDSDMTPDEYGEIFDREYIWAVDPIDGTVSFANGVPNFAVSVALLQNTGAGHKPVLGTCLLPALNELFFTRNGNSFLKYLDTNKEVQLTKPPVPKYKPVIMFNESLYRDFHLNYDMKKFQLVISASSVFNIIFTAAGRALGTVTGGHLWDFAGAAAIGAPLGVHLRSLDDGSVKDTFTPDDFIIGHPTRDWRLKERFVVSTEENYSAVRCMVERK